MWRTAAPEALKQRAETLMVRSGLASYSLDVYAVYGGSITLFLHFYLFQSQNQIHIYGQVSYTATRNLLWCWWNSMNNECTKNMQMIQLNVYVCLWKRGSFVPRCYSIRIDAVKQHLITRRHYGDFLAILYANSYNEIVVPFQIVKTIHLRLP